MNVKKSKEEWGKYESSQVNYFILGLVLNIFSIALILIAPVILFNPYNHVFNNILTSILLIICGLFCFAIVQINYFIYLDGYMQNKKREYKVD
jgi:cytochrome c biogenesis protein CcdA